MKAGTNSSFSERLPTFSRVSKSCLEIADGNQFQDTDGVLHPPLGGIAVTAQLAENSRVVLGRLPRHIVHRQALLNIAYVQQAAHRVHAGIEVGPGEIKVAGKGGGDLVRNLALTEAAEELDNHRQGRGQGVESFIEAAQDVMLAGGKAFQPRPLLDLSRPQLRREAANLIRQLRRLEPRGRMRPVFPVQPGFVKTVSFAVRL